MEATTVTHIWMAGVIGIMVAYAVCAIFGVIRRQSKQDSIK